MSRLLLLFCALLASCCLTGCDRPAQPLRQTQLLMGTVVEITLPEPPPDGEKLVARAFAEMRRIEALMSPHLKQSDLWKLNHSTAPQVVSPDTAAVLALGQRIAIASGGAFDMTLGRVKDLWDIEGEHPRIPTTAEQTAALRGIGPHALKIDGDRVTKDDPGLQVDLGGIAKGYAIDRAIAVLRDGGVKRASVNAGGDIRLLGDRGGRPWRIGIQHPRDPGKLLATLELSHTSVVTSGDYERYFEKDGIRYHHLFDPATGRPARRCQSATVVTADATSADALATAAFVLGPKAGMALLQREGAEGVLVDSAGKVSVSPGLKGKIKWP